MADHSGGLGIGEILTVTAPMSEPATVPRHTGDDPMVVRMDGVAARAVSAQLHVLADCHRPTGQPADADLHLRGQ